MNMIVIQVMNGLSICFRLVNFVILAYCVLSWITRPDSGIYQFVHRLAEPFIQPFRPLAYKLIRRGFMIDISPILALVALQILQQLIFWLLSLFF